MIENGKGPMPSRSIAQHETVSVNNFGQEIVHVEQQLVLSQAVRSGEVQRPIAMVNVVQPMLSKEQREHGQVQKAIPPQVSNEKNLKSFEIKA